MSSGKDDIGVINSICSVCGANFASVQECFKHELIKHSLQQNKSSTLNRVQKRLNAAIKFLNTDDKLKDRESLKAQLNKCKTGQELRTIFEQFCMNTDNLNLVFTRIQTCLEKELRSAGIVRIYPFGSIASGLALRDCDIDIFLDVSDVHTTPSLKHHIKNNHKSEMIHQRKAYNRINSLLQRSAHFTNVFAIPRARVPIIKCKHNDTGFSIDINVSYPSSRNNTQFINDLMKSDERIHELMLFLKLWAKNMLIIGRDNMTSYCLITMVIFFLQQPQNLEANKTDANNSYRILKSIKELQENCPFHMVQGVNYAYDLRSEGNKPEIPAAVTTWDLIKQFFNFYQYFNYEDYVISPYYGKSVAKTDLTPEICEQYYKQLNTITQYSQGEQANNFQIDRCMCVQDAFCLNQNTAKSISFKNRQYITMCLQNAYKICENPNKLLMTQLYEELLFETIKSNNNNNKNTKREKIIDQLNSNIKEKTKEMAIKDLENLTVPLVNANKAHHKESTLTCTFLPSKAEMRAVALLYPYVNASEELLRCWCHQYVNVIATIITKLFRIDMQEQLPTQQKQQKLDNEEQGQELNKSWLIFCTIDLWTNRYYQKNTQINFMSYQLKQTERLYALRRQDPKFSITINCVLKLNTLPNCMGIQLELADNTPTNCRLHKKGSLRKFFNVLKNTLQSCNFKEFLKIADNN